MKFLSFTPFPELSTERLLLRQMNANDAPQVFKLRTNDSVLKYLDRAPLQSIGEAEALIERVREDASMNEGINWGIALKSDPLTLIGTAGFWRLKKEHYRGEVGYMLLPEYTRMGYMKEALSEIIKYGFANMKLHSIEANINPGNKASEMLLKSCGFVKEAYFRENYYYDGRFLDSVIYSLVKPVAVP